MSTFPVTISRMAGEVVRCLKTMGRSAAVGKAEMPSTAFFTSIRVSSISISPVISICTLAEFSDEVDVIS